MTSLDPITLAVVKSRLEQVVDEMDATLFRSAFNPIIAEARDASHGMYDPVTGDTLAQGKSGLPIFVGAMAFAVRAVIAKAARDGDLADGDVYIFNDPYDGGTHLSDVKLVRPLYRQGRLFCWLASVGHWHDVGASLDRPYVYFLVADVAVLAVMLGPAVIAGLTVRPGRALGLLILSTLAAVAVADVSGLSKGEVERIWMPFMPWITLAVVGLLRERPSQVRGWLAAQAGLAIALQATIAWPW